MVGGRAETLEIEVAWALKTQLVQFPRAQSRSASAAPPKGKPHRIDLFACFRTRAGAFKGRDARLGYRSVSKV